LATVEVLGHWISSGFSHDDIARLTGKSGTWVSNRLRELRTEIETALAE
jgi:hypothetical protein